MANDKTLSIVISAKDNTSAAFGKTRAGVESISRQLDSMRNGLRATAGSLIAFSQIKSLANLADEVQNLNARIKLVTESSRQFAQVQRELYQSARDTGAGYEAVATLYTRLTQTGTDYGLTQTRILNLTRATTSALRVSGASTAESAAVVRQFSQALGSGVLRGDEFNSIMENGTRLAKALADGLGIPIGRLRALAEQGLLTTDIVSRAIESQSDVLQRESDAMPKTIGVALSAVRDEFGKTVDEINGSVGATKTVSTALNALAGNMQNVLGGVAVAASAALTVAMTRGAAATFSQIQATIARINAERQATATTLAHRQVVLSYAQAELQAAQATVAHATGMARLAAVQTALIPAQQRYAAAQAGLATAMTGASAAAGGLRLALGFIGGPLGLILTLLTTGATAWAIWGNAASSAGDKARESIDRANEAADRLRRQQKFGTGDVGAIKEVIALREKELSLLDETIRATRGGKPSAGTVSRRAEVSAELERRRADLKLAESLDPGRAAPNGNAALGKELLGKQLDAYLDQYREKSAKLKDAIAEFKRLAAEAGLSETSEKYRQGIAAIRAKFAGAKSARTPGIATALGVDRDAVAALRANLNDVLEDLRDRLREAEGIYERAYRDNQVSLQGYYDARLAIAERGAEEELQAQRTLMQALSAERSSVAGTKPKTAADQERQRARIADIDREIESANARILTVERERGQAVADISAERAKDLKTLQQQMADIALENATAGSAASAAQRADAIRQRNAELLARAEANESAVPGFTATVKRKIQVEIDRDTLDRAEAEFNAALERMRQEEESINVRRAAGLVTERQAREQLLDLQQRTAETVRGMLPNIEKAAEAIGPDAIDRARRYRLEFEKLANVKLVEFQRKLNEMRDAMVDAGQGFFETIMQGGSAKDAVLQFVDDVNAQLRRMLAREMSEKLFGSGGLLDIGKLFGAKSAPKGTQTDPMYIRDADAALNAVSDVASEGPGFFDSIIGLFGSSGMGFAQGGRVAGPGTGTSDSIPAMLSNGEFVMPATATQKYLPLLEAMRRGVVPGFADGGYVTSDGLAVNLPGSGAGPTRDWIAAQNGWISAQRELTQASLSTAQKWTAASSGIGKLLSIVAGPAGGIAGMAGGAYGRYKVGQYGREIGGLDEDRASLDRFTQMLDKSDALALRKTASEQLVSDMGNLSVTTAATNLSMSTASSSVQTLGTSASTASASISSTAAESAGGMFSGLYDAVNKMTFGLLDAVGGIFNSIKGWLGNVVSGIGGMFGSSGGGFGSLFGGLGSLFSSIFHQGGIAGGAAPAMRVPALAFSAAPRYHAGGIAGLKPDEVPAVLRRGEEVLTANDPRHRDNMGGAQAAQTNLKIINMIDSPSVVSEGLASQAGTRTFINVVKANRASVRAALGV